MRDVKVKNKIIITLGVVLLVIGFYFLSNNYLNEKVDNAYTYMNNLLLEDEEFINMNEDVETMNTDEPISLENTEEPKQESQSEYVDPYLKYYIGYLIIPKINLNKGFLSINSKYNTVNKNIQVVDSSDYPDVDKGNFIIAAHSGNSYLAYFKNLYKLTIGDVAQVKYNGKMYTYQLMNVYDQDKTGQIAIYRDFNKTTMTLVTCSKDSKKKQAVDIFERIKVENI